MGLLIWPKFAYIGGGPFQEVGLSYLIVFVFRFVYFVNISSFFVDARMWTLLILFIRFLRGMFAVLPYWQYLCQQRTPRSQNMEACQHWTSSVTEDELQELKATANLKARRGWGLTKKCDGYLKPIHGTWYRIPDYWNLMLDTWHLVPGIWYIVPDTWYLIHRTWYIVPDTWYLILIPDTWNMMPDRPNVSKWMCLLDCLLDRTHRMHPPSSNKFTLGDGKHMSIDILMKRNC